MPATVLVPEARQLTRAEGRALVDAEARQVLGVGVDEFLTRLDAGELDMDDDDVIGLVMLEPFARDTAARLHRNPDYRKALADAAHDDWTDTTDGRELVERLRAGC